mmetsp:Transcript_21290/g.70594  ORF Transcript_21290/g.70594 Transcript_21290/m.70594 type:complete len:107 (+) Transcript_21290:177-497(+)
MSSSNERWDTIFQKSELHVAAERGDVKKLTELVMNKGSVSSQDKSLSSPAHYAAALGNLECLKILVENNADYRSPNMYGYTPLRLAMRNKRESCVDYLRSCLRQAA